MDAAGAASEARFQAYVEALAGVLGHADRAQPLKDYCAGLILRGERKSVEPMAARAAPARTSAKHQSMLHFVGQSAWSDAAVLTRVRELVLPVIERRGGRLSAWMIDDTGVPKKGKHSVGVARQYCGQLGKQDNCQVAVTLSVGNDWASLPIAHQLYLPESWASHPERRAKAGVPEDIGFKTKPEIALDQIEAALAAGVPPAVVLADAGYGHPTRFRAGLTALGLVYAVGVEGLTSVWAPGEEPLPPKPWSGRGRPPTSLRRDGEHRPLSVKALAKQLGPDRFATVAWREGTNAELVSRFCAVRVRPAHEDDRRIEPHPVEWLLIEWPQGESEPAKYWLSTLPETTPIEDLVAAAKRRWRIERDYQELKQELGLGHYEGRSWRGFHHHATLCIAAYGFLISERETLPPSASRRTAQRQAPNLPDVCRPRGASAAPRAPRPKLDRHPATTPRRSARPPA